MRELSELTDVEEPAWPLLAKALDASGVSMEVLPVDPALGRASLLQLQVTARSWLGGMVLNCGGVVLDSGWVRIYGSPAEDASAGLPGGSTDLPSLAEVNGFPERFDPAWRPQDGGLVVGHDVLGGVFVLNGADPESVGRPGHPGEIVYFAPDSLKWEALEVGHGAWLQWLLSEGTDQFYDTLRWPGWRAESGALTGSQGLSVVPFLWSAEARRDLMSTSRRPVPLAELLDLHREFGLKLDKIDPGFLGDL
ncbi:DUF2625 family protein [Streptomyces sp. NPDC060011]|jgi:hypothetical protein|uniref:DUF2625 family protein n=1 Tax=unclassified Streptomyces TaxID=2593676 RepID=UPI0013BB7D20|nr:MULTISPECIES: DUF2625 family protein [unclassified Streptomyces]MCX4916662.1 DUF2625 domain-containing protein [Streptomyces sp. NBC_00687]MCX5131230.1 DUF2625 domain-containing protein [Streptomyces sp. NBC_00340]MCX5278757.1 DUF2625 domain-containing protein [Streptomyces sp. NBC_00198]NEB31406.1 DUF2625 family protein [Streptomyces sp. SID14446]WSK61487.1 DUF2625 domain-containing protein [Streptomyces sp. NBC_01281]